MRKEMALIQDITKLSLYVPQEYNDTMVDKNVDPPVKYMFMNLSIRSQTNIEKSKSIKCIYDIQDSFMFVFCHKSYAEEFGELMVEQYNFKEREKESVLAELENKILDGSVTGAHVHDSRMSSSSSSSSALSSRHGKEDGESSSDGSEKLKL